MSVSRGLLTFICIGLLSHSTLASAQNTSAAGSVERRNQAAEKAELQTGYFDQLESSLKSTASFRLELDDITSDGIVSVFVFAQGATDSELVSALELSFSMSSLTTLASADLTPVTSSWSQPLVQASANDR